MIYILIFLILLYGGLKYDLYSSKRNIERFIRFVFFTIIIVVGCRYRIGTDSITYTRIFESWPNIFNLRDAFSSTEYAPLFTLYFSLLRIISSEYIIVQIATAIIIQLSIAKFLKDINCEAYTLTFLFLYILGIAYALNCEVLRESLSVAMFLLSIKSFKDSNWKQYYIYNIIALLFHYGAFITLLLPLIRKLKFNIVVVCLLCALFVSADYIVSYVLNSGYLSVLSYILEGKVDSYTEKGTQAVMGVGAFVYKLSIPIAIAYYARWKKPDISFLEPLMIAYIVMALLSSSFWILFRYQESYFSFVYMIYAAICIVHCSRMLSTNIKIVAYIMILCFFSTPYIITWSNIFIEDYSSLKRYELVHPYTNYFNQETHIERELLYRTINK